MIFSVTKQQLACGGCFVWVYLLLLVAFDVIAIFVALLVLPAFAMDIGIITMNTLGVALSVFYTKKIELYADFPDSLPNLPSFGPEVSQTSFMKGPFIALISLCRIFSLDHQPRLVTSIRAASASKGEGTKLWNRCNVSNSLFNFKKRYQRSDIVIGPKSGVVI